MIASPSARAALLLTPLCLAIGFRLFSSWDVWWQLAIARDALATRSLLPLDPYSWSFPAAPFPHKDLGGYLVLGLPFEAFGHAGTNAVRALASLVLVLGLARCVPSAHRTTLGAAFAGALALLALQDRIVPRALIFSLALFPVVLALAEHARDRIRTHAPLLPLLLPVALLQCVWMNLHRGAMLGVVIWTGLLLAGLLADGLARLLGAPPRPGTAPPAAPPPDEPAPGIERASSGTLRASVGGLLGPVPTPRQLAALAALALAAFAGGLLTPSGLEAYTSGLSVSHDPIHRTRISEWAPLSWEVMRSLYGIATAAVVAAWIALIATWAQALRGVSAPAQVDLWHAGVLFVFTVQGVQSIRWMPEAAMVAVVVLARVSAPALARIRLRWAAPAVAVLALAAHGATTAQPHGIGDETDRYPARALAFARGADLGPRVHNAFVYGGWLIYHGSPRFQVWIDGRNDMVYPSTFYLQTVEAQQDPAAWQQLTTQLRGDWVLADNTPGRQAFTFLADDPEWMLVFWSEPALVWVRRSEHPELASRAYRFVDPRGPVEAVGAAFVRAAGDPARLRALEDELLRMIDDDPTSVRALALLALFDHATGPAAWPRRDATLALIDALHPAHPAAVELRARIGAGGEGPPRQGE